MGAHGCESGAMAAYTQPRALIAGAAYSDVETAACTRLYQSAGEQQDALASIEQVLLKVRAPN